jgi:hypothetical protein
VLLRLIGGIVNAGFDAQGAVEEGRFATYRATLRVIAGHPWLGTGQGTVVWGIPALGAEVSMGGT